MNPVHRVSGLIEKECYRADTYVSYSASIMGEKHKTVGPVEWSLSNLSMLQFAEVHNVYIFQAIHTISMLDLQLTLDDSLEKRSESVYLDLP